MRDVHNDDIVIPFVEKTSEDIFHSSKRWYGNKLLMSKSFYDNMQIQMKGMIMPVFDSNLRFNSAGTIILNKFNSAVEVNFYVDSQSDGYWFLMGYKNDGELENFDYGVAYTPKIGILKFEDSDDGLIVKLPTFLRANPRGADKYFKHVVFH